MSLFQETSLTHASVVEGKGHWTHQILTLWPCLRNTLYIYTCTCEQDKSVKIARSEHLLPSLFLKISWQKCPQSHWEDTERVDHRALSFIVRWITLIYKILAFFDRSFCFWGISFTCATKTDNLHFSLLICFMHRKARQIFFLLYF